MTHSRALTTPTRPTTTTTAGSPWSSASRATWAARARGARRRLRDGQQHAAADRARARRQRLRPVARRWWPRRAASCPTAGASASPTCARSRSRTRFDLVTCLDDGVNYLLGEARPARRTRRARPLAAPRRPAGVRRQHAGHAARGLQRRPRLRDRRLALPLDRAQLAHRPEWLRRRGHADDRGAPPRRPPLGLAARRPRAPPSGPPRPPTTARRARRLRDGGARGPRPVAGRRARARALRGRSTPRP